MEVCFGRWDDCVAFTDVGEGRLFGWLTRSRWPGSAGWWGPEAWAEPQRLDVALGGATDGRPCDQAIEGEPSWSATHGRRTNASRPPRADVGKPPSSESNGVMPIRRCLV